MKVRSLCAVLASVALLGLGTARAAVDKAVFRDTNYSLSWMNGDNADAITAYLTGKGYTMVDAKGLDDFMKKHIADRATSVVVFANDVVPDTIANPTVTAMDGNPRTPDNDLNRYLRTGGKVVYLADWPAYYIGLPDGSKTPGSDSNAAQTLEFFPANWCCNGDDASRKTAAGDVPMVVFNDMGKAWGLTKPWQTYRATDVADSASKVKGSFTVLGNPENNAMLGTKAAMPWVRTFTPDRPGSGIAYLYDRPNQSGDFADDDLAQIQKFAEYFPSGEVALTGIQGTVTGKDGKPLAGARVTTLDANGNLLDYITDTDGKYFLDVPAGSHTVNIVPLDALMEAVGGMASVNVTAGQVATQDLNNVVIQPVVLPTSNPDKGVYYDTAYGTNWTGSGVASDIHTYLVKQGYTDLDASKLADFMKAHATSKTPSVVVMSQDIAPDTVIDISSGDVTNKNILTDYMNAGGRVVQTGDIPFWNIAQSGGAGNLNPAANGSMTILGINAADNTGATMCVWDSYDTVKITADGAAYGLTVPWQSRRPTEPSDVDKVLATDSKGCAAAWIKNYPDAMGTGGYVRLWDYVIATVSDAQLTDLQHVAEHGIFAAPTTKGDLNGDGTVDIKDATISLQIAVGNVMPTAAQTAAGDVNGDGKLNIQDTTLILAAAVGIHPL